MRKTTEVTITDEGRDFGKVFVITEMSAEAAELWAVRAFNGAARANIEVPDSIKGAGIVGVFIMGIKMFLASDFPTVEILLKELMACVQFKPEPDKPFIRPIVGEDIAEVMTRVKLREEVIKLHTGFTLAEAIQKLTSVFPALNMSNTSTSPDSSEPSSPAA